MLAFTAAPSPGLYGCPSLRLRPLRGPRVQERLFLAPRHAYGVFVPIFFTLGFLLVSLCGASIGLRVSSEQSFSPG